MFSKKSQTCFLIAALLSLAACSSDQNKDGDGDAGKFMDEKATIAGPNIEGRWISSCQFVSYEKIYRIFDVTVVGHQVTRSEKKFNDAACTSVTKDQTYKGIFRFIEKYNDTDFNIEYAFDLGSGVTGYPQERIAFKNGNLYLSNFGITILENEALYRDGQRPVPPPVTSCTNYAGRWNMNGSYFRIDQTKCQEIHWINERFDGSVASKSIYLLDGVPRVIDNKQVTSSIKNSNWTLEFINDDGNQVFIEYSLQKVPCNLMNPDGSEYLTRKSYVNGRYSACTYWARY